jgi:hypothetical protein
MRVSTMRRTTECVKARSAFGPFLKWPSYHCEPARTSLTHLRHWSWAARVHNGFYPGSVEPLVKLVARSLARWSSREPPFKGTRAE